MNNRLRRYNLEKAATDIQRQEVFAKLEELRKQIENPNLTAEERQSLQSYYFKVWETA